MKTVSLIKEIYWNGFRLKGNSFLKKVLMVYSWVCFALLGLTLFVFLLSLAQGNPI